MYNSLSIEDFLALSVEERKTLAKSRQPLVIALEEAQEELIADVGKNALAWLGEGSRKSLDCRRIVDGQRWTVPVLTSDFLPKILLIAPWRMKKKEFLHLFTYLSVDQFYHWDAVNLSYKEAHDFVLYHSTHFHEAMVSVTDYCNLRCRMCPFHGEDSRYEFSASRKKRPQKELAPEDFHAYIDQLPKNKSLLYCGTGELFVSENAMPFLRYSAEKECLISILTNGMLLTPRMMDELVELEPASMIFSVDGHTADIVESIRLGCKFEVIQNNIRMLMSLRDKKDSKMRINVHCSLMPNVSPHKDAIYKFWKDFGIDGLTFFSEWTDWDTKITSELSSEKPPANIQCWAALQSPVLLTNGLIAPCTRHMQGEWGKWNTDWLPAIRAGGLDAAIHYLRRQRIDPASSYRKNCAGCSGKQASYMMPGKNNTHAEAYRFTDRTSAFEAGFVRHVSASDEQDGQGNATEQP